MRLPIQYALFYPQRIKSSFPRFDFAAYPNLTFEKPDMEAFPAIDLACQAMKKGGTMPCVLNAANEVAVNAFLRDKTSFLNIPAIVEKCMQAASFIAKPAMNDYIESDAEARKLAESFTNKSVRA